jgi:hypothetical protein
MLEILRSWLNSDKDYYRGAAIYLKVGDNQQLKNLFAKGPTDFTTRKLREELQSIYKNLKVGQTPGQKVQPSKPQQHAGERSTELPTKTVVNTATAEAPVNPDLYQVCKAQADKGYKEVMNLRAELFALANTDDYGETNTAEKIAQREPLALAVVKKWQTVSALYDKADYVRIHGKLPASSTDDDEEGDIESLPDHQVKQALDNARKNYNKMKKREQTPERVQLLQKHEHTIKKLEARWHSLKQG